MDQSVLEQRVDGGVGGSSRDIQQAHHVRHGEHVAIFEQHPAALFERTARIVVNSGQNDAKDPSCGFELGFRAGIGVFPPNHREARAVILHPPQAPQDDREVLVAALADAFENDVFHAESSGDAPVGQKFETVRKDGDFGQLGFGVIAMNGAIDERLAQRLGRSGKVVSVCETVGLVEGLWIRLRKEIESSIQLSQKRSGKRTDG